MTREELASHNGDEGVRIRASLSAARYPTPTIPVRLRLNSDFDRGFRRTEFLIHAHVRWYMKFGAMSDRSLIVSVATLRIILQAEISRF